MSLAERIAPTLAARARRAAELQAWREQRDLRLLAQFALLQARLDDLLQQALGVHGAVALVRTAQSLPVGGHSFATLPISVWTARASFNTAVQTVIFTPGLDFGGPEQFGRIAVAPDFAFAPARSSGDRIAQLLAQHGIVLRGASAGRLMLPWPDGASELGVSDLEAAFAAWWLR